jgi:hypothetical protein
MMGKAGGEIVVRSGKAASGIANNSYSLRKQRALTDEGKAVDMDIIYHSLQRMEGSWIRQSDK